MNNEKMLLDGFSDRFRIKKEDVLSTLMNTAFRQRNDAEVTKEQMIALLVLIQQYNLNPFTKEIYAYPTMNGVTPVVSVDGWTRIMNEHPHFDGVEFSYSENMIQLQGMIVSCPEWVDVTIHRKDRKVATTIREYLDEVYRLSKYASPWQTHPKRMLRHKGLIQCARIAFSFGGIYDEDEAKRIVDMGSADVVDTNASTHQSSIQQPAANSKRSSANRTLNEDEISDILAKLISRSKQYKNWQPAYHYVEDNFCNETQEKLNALLKEAEQNKNQTPTSKAVAHDVQPEQLQQPDQSNQLEQMIVPDVQIEQASFEESVGFY